MLLFYARNITKVFLIKPIVYGVFVLSALVLFTGAPVFAAETHIYDANGNLTSDGTMCYAYNDANRLNEVKKCNGSVLVAEYTYDYEGSRIMKKIYDANGALFKTVYSPTKFFEQVKLASNGATLNTSYYYSNNELVAKKNPDGTKNYFLNDHLNSTTVVTDQAGQVVERTTYNPYGEITSGGTQSKYQYTGQENDPESGLDYYQARYYSPQLKRFTQPDSIIPDIYNPQTLNRYAYVNNNPMTYNDPSGNQAMRDDGSIVGNDFAAFAARLRQNPLVALVDIPGLLLGSLGSFASEIRGATTLAKETGAITNVVKDTKQVSALKSPTKSNFRENLQIRTGESGEGAQAHHVFPQKSNLQSKFNSVGINIHEPQYGSWWSSAKNNPANHQSNSLKYNTDWENFLQGDPSKSDILNKGRQLGVKYGFKTNY